MRGKLILPLLALALVALLAARADAAPTDSIAEAAIANSRCLTCHPAEPFNQTYHESNHKALACTACHDWIHGKPVETPTAPAQPGADMVALSREWAVRVDENCRRCHKAAGQQLASSVHGSVPAGYHTTVLCADCHGSHNIFKASDPRSMVNRQNVAATCTNCHDPRIAESYQYSFHGSAVRLGDPRAATCVDCHGSHDILGPDTPGSQVNAEGVPATCAKCHVKAQPNFAKGVEHTTSRDRAAGFPLWLAWKIFLVIILIDVAKDGLLITLELLRKWRQTYEPLAPTGRDSHD
ncbi:MAG: hypothetical protein ACYC5Y_00090 [Symbiobacteriia bacterium]